MPVISKPIEPPEPHVCWPYTGIVMLDFIDPCAKAERLATCVSSCDDIATEGCDVNGFSYSGSGDKKGARRPLLYYFFIPALAQSLHLLHWAQTWPFFWQPVHVPSCIAGQAGQVEFSIKRRRRE
jgi:hypothetical protein